MSTEAETLIERTILRNLAPRPNGMAATGTLWAETVLDLPGTSYTAFKKSLQTLEEKGQVLTIEGEDRRKAKITDAGKARILEA
jgi:hypothetical protein